LYAKGMRSKRKRMCKDGVTPFGRPPMDPTERLSCRVSVRMTLADRRRLEEEAHKAGLTPSGYLLAKLRGKL